MRTTLLSIIVLLTLSLNLQAQEKQVADILYDAIYAEEISGELDKAADLYNQVLKNYKEDRQACAQALYHLGLIAEKSKSRNVEVSKGHYNTLISQYQEIGEYARLARARLQIIDDQNTFIDPRDGHKYKYVEIGDQIWMAENLAYMPWVNPPKKQEFGIWVYDYDGHDVAAAKATENYQKYGCLYDWTTAMDIDPKFLEEEWKGDYENHQGICPPGWRMPSDHDWDLLEMQFGLTQEQINERDDPENWYLGYYETCGANKLKSTSGWLSGGNGRNDLNFNFRPGGSRFVETPDFPARKVLQDVGSKGVVWTSTEYTDSLCDQCNEKGHVSFGRILQNVLNSQNDDNIYRSPDTKSSGFSVRCIKSRNPEKSDKKNSYLVDLGHKRKQSRDLTPNYISVKAELIKTIPRNDTATRRLYSGMVILNKNLINWTPGDSTLIANDLDSFAVSWKKKLIISSRYFDGVSSLLIDKDTIITSDKEKIIFINGNNGETIRSFDIPNLILMPINLEDRLIACSGRNTTHTFHCIDKQSGEKLWEYKFQDSITFSAPASDGKLLFFSLLPHYKIVKGFYDTNKPVFAAIDIKTGELRWSFDGQTSGNHRPPIIIENQVIFMHHGENYIYSFNKNTGEQNWKYYMDHSGNSNFVHSGNKLFFCDNQFFWGTSKVYAITTEGHELWKKPLLENKSPSMISSFPDGKITVPIGGDGEKFLMVLNKEKSGNNYMIEIPYDSKRVPVFSKNKMFIRTKDGILIYKMPDFKE